MAIENQDDAAQFESGYDNMPTETPALVVAEPEQNPAAPEPAATPAPDPLKELMARFDKFEAGHNKLAGHIGGLQRTQQEIQSTLAAAQAATKAVTDAPTQGEVKEAMASPAEWAALKADYPEWATATEKLLDSRMPKFDAKAFEEGIKREMVGQTAAVRQEIINASLDAVFPGWVDEVRSDGFKKWADGQTDAVKSLIASNNVGDAARMLKLYDASKQSPAQPAPAPKPETSTREKRIAAAVTPRGAGGHAAGGSDLDDLESGYSS